MSARHDHGHDHGHGHGHQHGPASYDKAMKLHEHFELRHITLQIESADFARQCTERAGACHP